MRTREILLLAAACALVAPAASAAVFKCRDTGGALTYQELPCDHSEQSLKSDIASEYPAPNIIERERLLLREQELYKRLEAQRDRLTAEAVARITRPEPAPIVVNEPVGTVLWPGWFGPGRVPQRPQPRNAMRAWSQGQLR